MALCTTIVLLQADRACTMYESFLKDPALAPLRDFHAEQVRLAEQEVQRRFGFVQNRGGRSHKRPPLRSAAHILLDAGKGHALRKEQYVTAYRASPVVVPLRLHKGLAIHRKSRYGHPNPPVLCGFPDRGASR